MSLSKAIDRQGVLEAIFATIDEINDTVPDDRKLEKSTKTPLFGREGKLDSLGLVNFIVLLEQYLADEFGLAITLADEKAVSRESSPFLTVQSLADYIIERLKEPGNG